MITNGGPAFPMLSRPSDPQLAGLSKRDYFAARALGGLVVERERAS
jgi:hypothetical protein